jgi:protein-S-isoprenylcysteine O-methyltransferase Ste14
MGSKPISPDIVAATPPRLWSAHAVDAAERLFLLCLFAWFVSRILPSVADQPYNMLILVSESLTAFLVLIRRPGPMATSLYAWLIAIVGTCSPLLVLPTGDAALIPIKLAAFLMVSGLFVSLAAKAFLRRSFGIVAASRGVRRGGPYRLVRHPMYSGYVITQIGFLLLNPSLWNVAVYAVTWGTLLLRVREEEAFLSQDPAYRAYQGDVRYRLLPGLF